MASNAAAPYLPALPGSSFPFKQSILQSPLSVGFAREPLHGASAGFLQDKLNIGISSQLHFLHELKHVDALTHCCLEQSQMKSCSHIIEARSPSESGSTPNNPFIT